MQFYIFNLVEWLSYSVAQKFVRFEANLISFCRSASMKGSLIKTNLLAKSHAKISNESHNSKVDPSL